MARILMTLGLLLVPITIGVPSWLWKSKDHEYVCPAPRYSTEILSMDPLIMYINNFVSESEIDHLLRLGEPLFSKSNVLNVERKLDESYRSSDTAFLSQGDPVTDCIGKRALQFLGAVEHESYEPMQLVRYLPGQTYLDHFDWFDIPHLPKHEPDRGRSWNRLSSFFTYLGDDPIGGETLFPFVPGADIHADGTKFARTADDLGLAIKPIKGNTVFWMNLHAENQTGDERVLHTGLPVRSGVKYGMNLWTKHYE